jgi:hypothetical protein
MTDKEALFLVGRECPTTNRDVVKALSHLTKLAEENAALKAEADSWRILSETHEGCGEEWAGRALKAEAEVAEFKRYLTAKSGPFVAHERVIVIYQARPELVPEFGVQMSLYEEA